MPESDTVTQTVTLADADEADSVTNIRVVNPDINPPRPASPPQKQQQQPTQRAPPVPTFNRPKYVPTRPVRQQQAVPSRQTVARPPMRPQRQQPQQQQVYASLPSAKRIGQHATVPNKAMLAIANRGQMREDAEEALSAAEEQEEQQQDQEAEEPQEEYDEQPQEEEAEEEVEETQEEQEGDEGGEEEEEQQPRRSTRGGGGGGSGGWDPKDTETNNEKLKYMLKQQELATGKHKIPFTKKFTYADDLMEMKTVIDPIEKAIEKQTFIESWSQRLVGVSTIAEQASMRITADPQKNLKGLSEAHYLQQHELYPSLARIYDEDGPGPVLPPKVELAFAWASMVSNFWVSKQLYNADNMAAFLRDNPDVAAKVVDHMRTQGTDVMSMAQQPQQQQPQQGNRAVNLAAQRQYEQVQPVPPPPQPVQQPFAQATARPQPPVAEPSYDDFQKALSFGETQAPAPETETRTVTFASAGEEDDTVSQRGGEDDGNDSDESTTSVSSTVSTSSSSANRRKRNRNKNKSGGVIRL